jgi:hypothetical protein
MILKKKSQLQTNNVTIEQAEPMALSKGCLPQFAKLKGDLLYKLQKDEKESKEDGEVEVDKDFGRKQENQEY